LHLRQPSLTLAGRVNEAAGKVVVKSATSRNWPFLILAGVLSFALPGQACNVPVFRYALEHWRPNPYEVIIFHNGPLSPKEQETVRRLEKHATGEFTPANLAVQLVDVDKPMTAPVRALFDAQDKPALPWMVVRTLDVDSNKTDAWAGKLSDRSANLLLDSPLRREVVKRLLGGATAVWIHVGSGDKDKDDASARVLSSELRRLSSELKLPTLTDAPEDKVSAKGPPLRVAFSMVRLRRDDPDEKFLLGMLLHSEAELTQRKEPMVFAVFGRGRCLAALVGRGLNAPNIKSACALLLAPCTCDVQTEMEWFELLTTADWQTFGTGVLPARSRVRQNAGTLPRLPRSGERGYGPWPLTPPATQPPPESRPLVPRWALLTAIGAVGLLVVLTGAWAARSGGKKEGR
jgi:hypothetical protein